MDNKRRRFEEERHDKARKQLQRERLTGDIKTWLIQKHCLKPNSAAVLEEFVNNLVEL